MKQQLTNLWESCISNSMTMRQQVAADLFGDDVPPTERVITRRFSQEDAASWLAYPEPACNEQRRMAA